MTAPYLINKFPTRLLQNLCPYQILYDYTPPYSHLKVFGCLCYTSTLKRGRDKFKPRAVPCVFIGHPYGKKAYKLYNSETKQILVSRYVVFHELDFPFAHSKSPPSLFASSVSSSDPLNTHSDPPPHPFPHTSQPLLTDTSGQHHSAPPKLHQPPQIQPPPQLPPTIPAPELRRSTRLSKQPSHLNDFVCNNVFLITILTPPYHVKTHSLLLVPHLECFVAPHFPQQVSNYYTMFHNYMCLLLMRRQLYCLLGRMQWQRSSLPEMQMIFGRWFHYHLVKSL